MIDCIFCAIIAGQGSASFIYRDEQVAAFLDTRPVNAGHVLVISNRHFENLTELDDDCGMHLFQIARRITSALYASGVPCEGVNLFLSDGKAAGQDIFHVHLHVIPRYVQDGVASCFLEHYDEDDTSREELDRIAQMIKNKM